MRRAIIFFSALILAGCAGAHHPDDAFISGANHLRPSVVLLTMSIPGDAKGSAPDREFASGIVIASGSWGSDILTVSHALDYARSIRLTIGNNQTSAARIIGRDTVRDIALVRTRKPNLPVVQLGSSADARAGASIGLLGYPIPDEFESEDLGLATSLSTGIISTIRREAIEVTLEIVPGESGGPIFLSDSGEIVGMAEARFEDEHSIGFAVPINTAKRFLHKYDSSHGF